MPWLRPSLMRSCKSGSFVVTAPPSPMAIVFTGWNEKHAIAEWLQSPTCADSSDLV